MLRVDIFGSTKNANADRLPGIARFNCELNLAGGGKKRKEPYSRPILTPLRHLLKFAPTQTTESQRRGWMVRSDINFGIRCVALVLADSFGG